MTSDTSPPTQTDPCCPYNDPSTSCENLGIIPPVESPQSYLFLDTAAMNEGETWGSYMARIQATLPGTLKVRNGRYVEDIRQEPVGDRCIEGPFDHSMKNSGHLFEIYPY